MNHTIIHDNNHKKNRKMYHKKNPRKNPKKNHKTNHKKMESDDYTTSDGLLAKMHFSLTEVSFSFQMILDPGFGSSSSRSA